MTKMALQPDATQTQDEVAKLREEQKAALEAHNKELEALKAQVQQKEAEEAYRTAQSAFLEHTEESKDYPLLSRLDPEKQLAYASQVAVSLQEAGVEFDYPDVAKYIETGLQELVSTLTSKEAAAAADEPEKGSGQSTERPPQKTLTNTQASQSSAPAGDMSEEDRVRAAINAAAQGLQEVETGW
jgi:hypothetical protein